MSHRLHALRNSTAVCHTPPLHHPHPHLLTIAQPPPHTINPSLTHLPHSHLRSRAYECLLAHAGATVTPLLEGGGGKGRRRASMGAGSQSQSAHAPGKRGSVGNASQGDDGGVACDWVLVGDEGAAGDVVR